MHQNYLFAFCCLELIAYGIINIIFFSLVLNSKFLLLLSFLLSLVCETVKHRSATGILHGVFYTLGAIAATAISQLLPNWRHFQLACACSYALFIPYYW